MSSVTILLSDGTTGSCFSNVSKSVGLNALALEANLSKYKIVERPQVNETTSKRWGSGKFPYTNFIKTCLQPILLQELRKGQVLLVCYSFSCRAASLMFDGCEESDKELMTLIQNLIGIVMLSPPCKEIKKINIPVTISLPSHEMNFKEYFNDDWTNSYIKIPSLVPVHFFVGGQVKHQKLALWTKSLVDALNKTDMVPILQTLSCNSSCTGDKKPKALRTFHIITRVITGTVTKCTCNEKFVCHVKDVAAAIDKIILDVTKEKVVLLQEDAVNTKRKYVVPDVSSSSSSSSSTPPPPQKKNKSSSKEQQAALVKEEPTSRVAKLKVEANTVQEEAD